MKILIWVVVVAAIIAGFLAWKGNKDVDAASLVVEENAVIIEDQQPGDETVVSYAKLSQSGYVVVRSKDAAGVETIIGSSELLPAGEHRNVRVAHRTMGVLRPGSIVMAHVVADDGDGSFSEETDTEMLTETSDEAEISADAELDLSMSDEELAELLEDAGYETTVEVEGSMEEESMEDDMMDDTVMEGEEVPEGEDEMVY